MFRCGRHVWTIRHDTFGHAIWRWQLKVIYKECGYMGQIVEDVNVVNLNEAEPNSLI
jgi:hypothetical protein